MLRGFLGGVLSGTVISGVFLGALSLMTEVPGTRAPETAPVEVPAGSEFNQSRQDTGASLPRLEQSPEPEAAPEIAAPEPDDLISLGDADTEPASEPVAGGAQTGLSAPDAQTASGFSAGDAEEPVLPNPQALPPEVPEAEDSLSISTEPAQPVQPDLPEQDSGFPATGADEEEAVDEDGQTRMAPEPEAPARNDPAEPLPGEDPAQAELSAPAEDEEIGITGDLASGVTTNRLPKVAGDAENEAIQPAEAIEVPAEDTRPPLERFAAEFENPEGKPLMSIVLIDDGSSPIGPDAVLDFPYPISLAVDAGWPGAMQRSQAYRAAGFEVLAMADLPDGASAADTEVAMQAFLAAVPSATVFRDFDGAGQNEAAIRRFLDQAAFRAGQEEVGVIMVGRLRPETISALLLWGLQDRASRVALAPVSEVLRGR